MAAKQRVARLQRDLLRVRSDEALRTLQARNRELVSSMRAEATLRRMRPTTSDMLADGVEAADEADVVNVASQLFSRMQQMQPTEATENHAAYPVPTPQPPLRRAGLAALALARRWCDGRADDCACPVGT